MVCDLAKIKKTEIKKTLFQFVIYLFLDLIFADPLRSETFKNEVLGPPQAKKYIVLPFGKARRRRKILRIFPLG